ncbi:MAG: serine hydrolase domain-containing protein [Microthrixaceae bacterium]
MTFPTSTPSREGIDPAALLALLDAVDAHPGIEPHGLIVQRHGRRVLEGYWAPHRAGQARLVYSLSKTFTGTALGLALGDGLLDLDDLVVDHLPELLEGADERTRRMRVRHLASMASGHQDETLLHAVLGDPEDPLRGFFRLEPEHEPGTWFAYNQPPVLALATILQRLTGERLVEQLRPRVLDPVGIGALSWYQYRPGVDLGFSGVYTDLDAIARLGQLYLDDGCWQGDRLLPEGWVAQASAVQTDNSHRPEPDWSQGYGFQLWVGQHGYRGDGAFGQYMVVLPEHDTVVAFFSTAEPMQPFLDLLWSGLLPALGPAGRPDPAGDEALAERVAALALPTAAERTGERPGADAAAAGTFRRAPGPNHASLTSAEVADGTLVLHEDGQTLVLPLTEDWTDVSGHQLAASAATRSDGGLEVDVVALATPHRLELRTFPADGTYSATWPLHPLFGLGLELELGAMRPPD